jgi:hypothetical protein
MIGKKMMNRRNLVVGAPILIASFVLPHRDAQAGLFGSIKRVASTVIQGINFVTNPAAQVAAATRALAPIVKQLSPDLARANEMINKISSQASTMEGRLRIAAGVLAPQALPIFANVGFEVEPITTYAQQAGQPLTVSSSLEDELRQDPIGYIQRNTDLLDDYIRATGGRILPHTFTVPGGDVISSSIASDRTRQAGYFPSVLNIQDVLRLISIFKTG